MTRQVNHACLDTTKSPGHHSLINVIAGLLGSYLGSGRQTQSSMTGHLKTALGHHILVNYIGRFQGYIGSGKHTVFMSGDF